MLLEWVPHPVIIYASKALQMFLLASIIQKD